MAVQTPVRPVSVTSDRAAAAPIASLASTAFGLGWHVAELFHFRGTTGDEQTFEPDRLPGINQLTSGSKADLLLIQIGVAVDRLGPALKVRDGSILERSMDSQAGSISKEEVWALHERLLKRLTAEDSTLGAAYDLGRALAETAVLPFDDPGIFARRFSPGPISALKSQLSDLRSRFPTRAAEAVERTLDAWQNWIAEKKLIAGRTSWTPEEERTVIRALHRQGQIWYALLSGDMDSGDLLTFNDYLGAIKTLFSAITRLVGSFVIRLTSRSVVPLVLLGTIAVIVVLMILVKEIALALLGPLIILVGLLGITITGVMSSLRQPLQQAGARLWDAELLDSIAYALTNLPQLPKR